MRKFLSGIGLWAILGAFVFGAGWAVVSPAAPAHATDTATFLGVIEVDCTAGELYPQTIVFTGGVGDTFKFLSSSGNCTVDDSQDDILSGGSTLTLVAGVVSAALTITGAGEFTVTDAGGNAVTFTIHAGPVFGNHNRGALPVQTERITCNGLSGSFSSNISIYFQADGDKFRLFNSSGSRGCASLADPNNILTDEPALINPGATSGEITIEESGSFTITTVPDAEGDTHTITFRVVEGKQPDIGSGLAVNGTADYPDVFYSVATGVVDARVTLVGTTNLESNLLDVLDENLAPNGGNWALAPTIDIDERGVEGSATVRIDFFQSGTTTPVDLTNLSATVVDIDNSQFVSVPDVTSFEFSSNPSTVLSASRSGNVLRVNDPTGEGSQDADQENWVVLNFAQASSLEFTFGGFRGGPSFAVVFAPAPWSATPTTIDPTTISLPVSANGIEGSNQQGIHLDLRASPGARVDATSALMEGQGLLVSSTYALRLGPGGQSLKSGQVSSGGRFSHEIRLPSGLAPGRYFVELSATGRNGANLVLHQSFTVGPGGVITLVSSANPGSSFQGSLAATGPDAAVSMSLNVAGALLVLGLMALVLSRFRRFLGAK